MALEDQLLRMLIQLEIVSEENEEIFDTVCRDLMGLAIMDGFVRGRGTEVVPEDLGLYSDEANERVAKILVQFIVDANAAALAMPFRDRLNAFQNSDLKSSGGNYFDDFFGYTRPEFYDADGNVVRTN